MTTAQYRQVLERQRRDVLRREDGYPISDSLIEMMVNRYAEKRETAFAKIGLSTQRRLILRFANSARQLELSFAAELKTAFEGLGEIVANGYLAEDSDIAKAEPEPIDADLLIMLRRILQGIEFAEFRETNMLPIFETHYFRTATATVNGINAVLDVGIDLPDPVMRRVVETGGTRLGLVDIDNATRRALFDALHAGRIAGEGPPDLAERIKKYVSEGHFRNAGVDYRAMMIARTETKYAQNVSSLEAYAQVDTLAGLLAFDNQTGYDDEDCMLRDGRVFTLEEAAAETAREHPNGTLSWAPVIP